MTDPRDWQQSDPGRFPPAQPYPPNQYQPGQYQPGQYQPSQFPPGQYPPGQPYSADPFSPGQPYSGGNQPPPGAPWPGPPVAPRPSRRRWWIIGGALVVIVIVVAAVGVTLFTRGNDTGADSPTAAVRDFLTAGEQGDVLAAADLLDPAERDSVRAALDNASRTAEQTGFQQGGGGNGPFNGMTLSADNVQTEADEIGDDLARVTMRGGEITFTFDPAKANEGMRDLLAGKNTTRRTWTADDLALTERGTGDRLPPALMTVQRSGKWYVSLMYSYFDAAARIQGVRPSSARVQTRSYSSPEEAARGFVDGAVGMMREADPTRLAETLSPDEGQLVQTYRELFSDRDLRKPISDLEVTGRPRYDVTTNGDTATVSVRDLTLEYTPNGSGSTQRIDFPDCTDGDASWCNRTRLQGLRFLPGLAEVNRRGFVATKDAEGWHVNLFASYVNVAAEYLGKATKAEVAMLFARFFKDLGALRRLDAQATVDPGSSASVDLEELPNTAGQYLAVVDVPVRSGTRYVVTASAPDGVEWVAVDEDGESAAEANYYGDDGTASFTAARDETLKVVLVGSTRQSVRLSVEG